MCVSLLHISYNLLYTILFLLPKKELEKETFLSVASPEIIVRTETI